MASDKTLLKKIINVKGVVINNYKFDTTEQGVQMLYIDMRPYVEEADKCPYCNRKCPRDGKGTEIRRWRDLDWNGLVVEFICATHYVSCAEHGRVVAGLPWSFPRSGFTKRFDLTVTWFAKHLTKNLVCDFFRIDYKTVGRCVKRSLDELEPDIKQRLNGLVNIGVDETSYKKGHKYITVIVNHDTNEVVWIHLNHGDEVFKQFFEELTEEQRSSIKSISGDGAKWIQRQAAKYVPSATVCVDPFHAVSWATKALDEFKNELWRAASNEAKSIAKEQKDKGIQDDPASKKTLKAAKEKASKIKGTKYALLKNPENLTARQNLMLEEVEHSDKRLGRAYRLKESLRLIFHEKRLADETNAEFTARLELLLKQWFWKAAHGRIDQFKELAYKVRRNQKGIIDAIVLGLSNARIEATNNKIKVVIRRSYGFGNPVNMMSLIYLVCSNIEVPLPNRPMDLLKAS